MGSYPSNAFGLYDLHGNVWEWCANPWHKNYEFIPVIMLYLTFSVALLALLLFFPVSKLVWVLSVRRLQRKLQRELSQEEFNGQLARARFISVLIVLLFSLLFNINLIDYG